MGKRFRKSVNLGGGARVNFSKSGVGFSAGTKGARITKKANGGVRTTTSIPGTGISYVTDSKKKQETAALDNVVAALSNVSEAQAKSWLYWVCWALWLPMILISCLLALVFPAWLLGAVVGVVEFVYIHKTRKKQRYQPKYAKN